MIRRFPMNNVTRFPEPAAARVLPARQLDGRVAIVTGSTSGIGLGVASALAEAGAIAAMAERTARTVGPADILVNNAGIQHVAPIESFPPEKWDLIIAINLSAVFHGTRAVLPEMKRRGWGRIVNVASAHGLIGSA